MRKAREALWSLAGACSLDLGALAETRMVCPRCGGDSWEEYTHDSWSSTWVCDYCDGYGSVSFDKVFTDLMHSPPSPGSLANEAEVWQGVFIDADDVISLTRKVVHTIPEPKEVAASLLVAFVYRFDARSETKAPGWSWTWLARALGPINADTVFKRARLLNAAIALRHASSRSNARPSEEALPF